MTSTTISGPSAKRVPSSFMTEKTSVGNGRWHSGWVHALCHNEKNEKYQNTGECDIKDTVTPWVLDWHTGIIPREDVLKKKKKKKSLF